ncbi:hypothetical protein J7E97_33050 [Streptomyces sp. ISL-66]|uniref:hypothetical protein n=1 Tax=Streptomyces sp. ISL-66 TaxID=2819186 RepID=UPI001BE758B2|nr:hypothetical protein [Streptomyces sp. ISL-66]MBT2472552.1 hypothetical protein [Streptomyces sp. ISL-66]
MTALPIDSQPQQPSARRRFVLLLLVLGYLAVAVAVAAVTYVVPALGDPVQTGLAAAALAASLRPVRVVVVQEGGPAGAGPV